MSEHAEMKHLRERIIALENAVNAQADLMATMRQWQADEFTTIIKDVKEMIEKAQKPRMIVAP